MTTKETETINYSDGESVEQTILDLLKAQPDDRLVSTGRIASEKYDSWPIEYHLCPERSNILRPFNFSNLKVLDLGAGFGAVSRHLAENAKSVTFVEGTRRRFEGAQERLRPLKNCQGFLGNLQDFSSNEKFDLICVVGLLEYSELYLKPTQEKESCFDTFLQIVKKNLHEDGVILLAIENKLGLKYWAGAGEDHSGRRFDGICGYRKTPSAKTFSKQELEELFRKNGFAFTNKFYPFPDYKIPTTVLSEDLLQQYPKLASTIGTLQPFRDYASVFRPLFPSLLAMRNLANANLLEEFSNSFLFISSLKEDSWVKKSLLTSYQEKGEIGWHYAFKRKLPIQTTFEKRKNLPLKVRKQPLVQDVVATVENNPIMGDHSFEAELCPGENLRFLFSQFAFYRNWDAFKKLLVDFTSWSLDRWKDPLQPALLKGNCLDAIWNNACQTEDGQFHLFDLEWTHAQPLKPSYFIFRNVIALSDFSPLLAGRSPWRSLIEIYHQLCLELQVPSDPQSDFEQELFFQDHVTHQDPRLAPVMKHAFFGTFETAPPAAETNLEEMSLLRRQDQMQKILRLKKALLKGKIVNRLVSNTHLRSIIGKTIHRVARLAQQ